MRESELGQLTQFRRQPLEAAALQSPHCAQLLPGRAARTHEIRVIGVRKPVCPRLRGADDSSLREGQNRARGTGRRQHLRDRLGALGVGEGMAGTLLDPELDLLGRRDLGDELRAAPLTGPQLQMGARDTPRTEQGAAEVGAPAARPRDDTLRRPVERRQPRAQHPGLVEHLERAALTLDVELVARPALEGAAPVAADLTPDAEAAKQRERPTRNRRAGHVQVDGHLAAAAQVDRPGGVEERRQLRELVALPPRGDRGELVANVLRKRHVRLYDHRQ